MQNILSIYMKLTLWKNKIQVFMSSKFYAVKFGFQFFNIMNKIIK